MPSSKLEKGINDLATLFPEVAAEADGWDPSEIIGGSNKKLSWICNEGHTWDAVLASRTGKDKRGCPICAEHGFNPEQPAWFYLMSRNGEQQFGISNNLRRRFQEHALKGWKEMDKTGPYPGKEVLETESKLKTWLKKEVGLITGSTENWYTSNLEVHSLAELKEKSGIETSIF